MRWDVAGTRILGRLLALVLPQILLLAQLYQFAEKSELDQCHLPKSLHYSGEFSNVDGLCAHGNARGHSLLRIPPIENPLGLHYRGFAGTLR